MVNHLKTSDMHTTSVHPGMACPDTPGLEEETSVDSLLEEDLLSIATTLKNITARSTSSRDLSPQGTPSMGPWWMTFGHKSWMNLQTQFSVANRWEPSKKGTHG